MHLRMIGYGMLAGSGFLLAVMILAKFPPVVEAASSEADITEEVWQVLAEARRIVEENA